VKYGEHTFIAVAILLLIYFAHSAWLKTSIVLLFVGAILPDIIEPANHYTHRKFFHSVKLLLILLVATVISFIITLLWFPFSWIFYFCLGYVSHLVADATTKMGLPDN
jgi:membrane-bound metal-dependent hydrolase YbcI (DUF457 family)